MEWPGRSALIPLLARLVLFVRGSLRPRAALPVRESVGQVCSADVPGVLPVRESVGHACSADVSGVLVVQIVPDPERRGVQGL